MKTTIIIEVETTSQQIASTGILHTFIRAQVNPQWGEGVTRGGWQLNEGNILPFVRGVIQEAQEHPN